MEYVRCVCVWLGTAWVVSRCEDWVWALPIQWEQGGGGGLDMCLCFGCSGVGVGGVGGECVGGFDQGLEGWCYVCVSCESGFSV